MGISKPFSLPTVLALAIWGLLPLLTIMTIMLIFRVTLLCAAEPLDIIDKSFVTS
jgi:hypothetical protein